MGDFGNTVKIPSQFEQLKPLFPFMRREEPLTCHCILAGRVLALVAVVTGVARRLVVLPVFQGQHVSGRGRCARCTLANTHSGKDVEQKKQLQNTRQHCCSCRIRSREGGIFSESTSLGFFSALI